jgi:1,4-alpha-glucan branching enzyme
MLHKKVLAGGKVEVTFRMPPMDDVVELYLSGDFNAWHVKGLPLNLESDGTWVGKLILEAGKSYRFRYHDNQGTWHTDYEADRYVTNDFGSDDSVVDVIAVAKEPLKAKPAKKTKAPGVKSGSSKKTKAAEKKKSKPVGKSKTVARGKSKTKP